MMTVAATLARAWISATKTFSIWTCASWPAYKRAVLSRSGRKANLNLAGRRHHQQNTEELSPTMNVNFFEWLRDGVRQSVLLGVSDAIEQIGTPADSDDLHPNVAALLTGDPPKSKRTRGGGRKRLGKSLKDIDGVE